MAIPISQRIPNNEQELYRQMFDAFSRQLRVACPGIIQSFDATTQNVTVQCAIRERIQDPNTLEYSWVNIPLLVDVPIVLPRAGNTVLTMPVQKGDECLVVFGDMAMDGWWQHGGIQNQVETRRHDLSDGFAIVGLWSQPNVISDYSTTAAQLRNLSGTQYIEVSDSGVNIVGNVTINGTAY